MLNYIIYREELFIFQYQKLPKTGHAEGLMVFKLFKSTILVLRWSPRYFYPTEVETTHPSLATSLGLTWCAKPCNEIQTTHVI